MSDTSGNLVIKRQMMLFYLQNIGDLSTMDAIREIGTTRPSNLIMDLREEHIITTTMMEYINKFGKKCLYGIYHYVREKTPEEIELGKLRTKLTTDGEASS